MKDGTSRICAKAATIAWESKMKPIVWLLYPNPLGVWRILLSESIWILGFSLTSGDSPSGGAARKGGMIASEEIL